MQQPKIRDKLFFRYLCSYLTLVFIPIFVISIFYSISFSQAFKNEILLNVDKDLQNIATQIDHELSRFNGIVQQASISSPFRSISHGFDPARINETKDVLFAYAYTNPFVDNIYATFSELGYVISSTTSISIPYLTTRYYLADSLPPEEMSALFQGETAQIQPIHGLREHAQLPRDVILFSYPLHTDYLKHISTIVFEVSHDTVETMINDKLGLYQAQTIILSPDSSLIGCFGADERTAAFFASLPEVGGMDAVTAQFEEDYIIRQYHSSESGFQYVTLIPQNQQVFVQLTKLHYLFMAAVLIVAVISCVAIAQVLQKQYFPLRRLHDKAEHLVKKDGTLNMISDIEDALNMLNGQNASLVNTFEKNAFSIKNDRLRKLLAGGYASAQDFNVDCQELNMHLGREILFATTTLIHEAHSSLDEIGRRMKEGLSMVSESYYLHTLESRKLIMVHSASADAYDRMPELIASLHSEILKEMNVLLTTGIGSVIRDTYEFPLSYFHANAALDYSFVKGKGRVILYRETNGDSSPFAYPQQQFDKLKNALLSKNESNVSRCIDETIQLIQKNNYPLVTAKGMCFTLINMTTATKPGKPGRFEASEMGTLQDIAGAIKEWRNRQNIPDKPQKDNKMELHIGRVMHYLKEHCLDCDFSINETAEHFGMLLPKFSQYFKDQMGQNILDFTIALRMNEAVRLLSDTDLGMQEIALKTGYYNTSSFIRRFKQTKGITPGEFRKVLRK